MIGALSARVSRRGLVPVLCRRARHDEVRPAGPQTPGIGRFASMSAAEGVTVDKDGIIYGAEVGPKRLMRYVKR